MGAGERSLQTQGGRGVTPSGKRLFVEMVPFSGEFLVCLVGAAGQHLSFTMRVRGHIVTVFVSFKHKE